MAAHGIPSSQNSGLADRALELFEQTSLALVELARREPETAVALARRLYIRVAERSKSDAKLPDPHSAIERSPVEFATPEKTKVLGAHVAIKLGNADIRSFLKPHDIAQRSLRNRTLRGALFDDIILLLLHANSDRDLVAADVKGEFVRLDIQAGETALLSRIARLRESGCLEKVSVTGTGLYRLTEAGRKAAQTAKDRRSVKV